MDESSDWLANLRDVQKAAVRGFRYTLDIKGKGERAVKAEPQATDLK